MTPDRAFALASNLAVLGWLLLLASLFVPAGWLLYVLARAALRRHPAAAPRP